MISKIISLIIKYDLPTHFENELDIARGKYELINSEENWLTKLKRKFK